MDSGAKSGETDRAAWTAYAEREGLLRLDRAPAPNKYHAAAVYVDGIRFASKKEAGRYRELRLAEQAGLIADLVRQPVFPLHVMELWRTQGPIVITTVGKYTADFQYVDQVTGEIVVEDVKSDATRTEAYRLRKRIAELIHGISVREV